MNSLLLELSINWIVFKIPLEFDLKSRLRGIYIFLLVQVIWIYSLLLEHLRRIDYWVPNLHIPTCIFWQQRCTSVKIHLRLGTSISTISLYGAAKYLINKRREANKMECCSIYELKKQIKKHLIRFKSVFILPSQTETEKLVTIFAYIAFRRIHM